MILSFWDGWPIFRGVPGNLLDLGIHTQTLIKSLMNFWTCVIGPGKLVCPMGTSFLPFLPLRGRVDIENF